MNNLNHQKLKNIRTFVVYINIVYVPLKTLVHFLSSPGHGGQVPVRMVLQKMHKHSLLQKKLVLSNPLISHALSLLTGDIFVLQYLLLGALGLLAVTPKG